MTIAVIGIGPPGSGRVDFFQQLLRIGGQAIYYHWDEGYGRFDGLDHHHEVNIAECKFYDGIAASLRQGQNIIADATNIDSKIRQKLIAFCRDNGASRVIGVIVNAPTTQLCSTSIINDRCRVIEQERLQRILEATPPRLEDGFDQIIDLSAYSLNHT